jgi:CubicO group peptidase (beta-lactamase class C family)
MDAKPEAELREAIASRLRAGGVTAAVLCVITPEGLTRRTTLSFGAAAKDTAFRLFSGTKLFTSAAVMRLVHQGAFSLDTPVTEVLTASGKESTEDWSALEGVTVRALLSHTSGLHDQPLSAIFRTHDPTDPAPSTADVLARFKLRRPAPTDAPRPAAYANINYLILGLLIERATAQPFAEALHSLVLQPLGSAAALTSPAPDRTAVGTIGPLTSAALATMIGPGALRSLLAPTPEAISLSCGVSALRPADLDGAPFGGLVGSAADFAPLVESALATAWGTPRPAFGLLPHSAWAAGGGVSVQLFMDAVLVSARRCVPAAHHRAQTRTGRSTPSRPHPASRAPTAKSPTSVGRGKRPATGVAVELVPGVALEIVAPQPVGVKAREGACLGWKAGVCPATTGPVPLPSARFRSHEGGGGGFTSELRLYLPDDETDSPPAVSNGASPAATPLGVVLLLNKWSVGMRECNLAHDICEMVRAAHASRVFG